ncbi:6-phosphogluconate dehydrogenase [Culex quinquefasciatus]|uniref:phosphogluconate dehydrogenase (NADP(+)-dependent, decarboxylating) n=1 Tax=Culex quinquefasciatus TaxID=7176 RepID=B0XIF4_CULQU|nr:6-phosphogluconate dehydrogenase [Culex quinquefasciatus]|eukprot:XP_001869426.1 6-phosphogluconate dehydrogenase [Culex quinquefasciatus]
MPLEILDDDVNHFCRVRKLTHEVLNYEEKLSYLRVNYSSLSVGGCLDGGCLCGWIFTALPAVDGRIAENCQRPGVATVAQLSKGVTTITHSNTVIFFWYGCQHPPAEAAPVCGLRFVLRLSLLFWLMERIRDTAGQKGIGKWTAIVALHQGVRLRRSARPSSRVACPERAKASKQLAGPFPKLNVADRNTFLTHIRSAVYCANIVSYGNGFMLLRKAVNEYKWNLDFDGIALMWRGGCIIRSVFLENIRNSFVRNPAMSHLLLDNFFKNAIVVPVPVMSATLSFFDGYLSERLSANLLQAQRDYLGAHTYELLGKKQWRQRFRYYSSGPM